MKTKNLCIPTWKFFSFHAFFAINLTTTSESACSTTPSSHVVISSTADRRVFQFAFPRSADILEGIKSAAKASASSCVCLYFTVSSAPGATRETALDFDSPAAVGGNFLTAGAGPEDGPGDESEAASDAFFCCQGVMMVSALGITGLTVNRAGGFLTAFGGPLKASGVSSGAEAGGSSLGGAFFGPGFF